MGNLMNIRRACNADCAQINRLLYQVHGVHAKGRPDLFIPGKKKYNESQLLDIIANDEKPIFVAEEDDKILGYAFCVFQKPASNSMQPVKTLYIDDLCVDENCRGGGVGKRIFEFVKDYAKKSGCYNLTLNVWECNPGARAFYEKCGLSVLKTGMEQIL